jgi:hypothetical protein
MDYFDIYYLARHFFFDERKYRRQLAKPYKNRGTAFEKEKL